MIQLKIVPKATKIENIAETRKPLVVDCTSHAKDEFQELSPFLAGPVELADGRTAINMENGWQFSKVFPEHIGKYENVDRKAYKAWSEGGMASQKAARYPFGKGVAAKFSLLGGKRLSYVEARQAIYIPLYVQAVRNTKAYKKLEKAHKKGKEIILLDFDAYRHWETNMTWVDVIKRTDKKMGHGFVLAMMLDVGPDALLAMVGAHYAIGLEPVDHDSPPWDP